MAAKSSLYDYFWWVPESEIGDEKPTTFLMRQMSKKQVDIVQSRTQESGMMSIVLESVSKGEVDIPERVRNAVTSISSEKGFQADIYRSCVKEIRNIWVLEENKKEPEFYESITDGDAIVNAIAGLEDMEIGTQLDDVLWRNSKLEDFELRNFTPPSGSHSLRRIVQEKNLNVA